MMTLLSACSHNSQDLSLSALQSTPELSNQLAIDAVNKLASLYPPAKTQLKVSTSAEDSFGIDLVKGLRQKGYAISEKQIADEIDNSTISGYSAPRSQRSSGKILPSTATAKSFPAHSENNDALPMSYIVDHLDQEQIYLLLKVGDTTLTRLYTIRGNTLYTAGFWSKGEL